LTTCTNLTSCTICIAAATWCTSFVNLAVTVVVDAIATHFRTSTVAGAFCACTSQTLFASRTISIAAATCRTTFVYDSITVIVNLVATHFFCRLTGILCCTRTTLANLTCCTVSIALATSWLLALQTPTTQVIGLTNSELAISATGCGHFNPGTIFPECHYQLRIFLPCRDRQTKLNVFIKGFFGCREIVHTTHNPISRCLINASFQLDLRIHCA
jgi:hypothetical protein